jgi:hypothetical protein
MLEGDDVMEERSLEALAEEITTLAAHVSAVTCRWLGLIAEFDRREGWGQWGCKSCAHWVAWRCSLTPATARDHVRIARRLEALPLIRAAFGRGELSFSKVRALVRVEEVEREEDLLELARSCTASQLERLVRAYRGVAAVEAGAQAARDNRYVEWHHDDDGAVVLRGRLPAEEGELVIAALEAAREALWREQQGEADARAADSGAEPDPHADPDPDEVDPRAHEIRPASTRPAGNADALLALAGGTAGVQPPQVVVHVDVETLIGGSKATVGVLDTGAPVPAETVRRLCCDAALVPMAERDGRPLSVGRRTRTIPPAIRRALDRRDGGCRFPGCQQRRHVDAHHVRHWADGGETSVDNLLLLCRHHHRLVHEEGYRVDRRRGDVVFHRPDGRRLRAVPRPRRGDAEQVCAEHRRSGIEIDAQTSVPRWWGEPLLLDDAVQAMLAIAPLREKTAV